MSSLRKYVLEQYHIIVKIISLISSSDVAATYFVMVATVAAFAGQHVVRKAIAILGRASIIIFILALTIFISAISLGTDHITISQ